MGLWWTARDGFVGGIVVARRGGLRVKACGKMEGGGVRRFAEGRWAVWKGKFCRVCVGSG